MTSPIRPRGCGCLMLFSIFCLTVFTAAEISVLFWINPEWFDRQAFWRGPILPPDVVLTEDPFAREALEREDAEDEARRQAEDSMKYIEERAVETAYQPGQAARLTTKEDGRFEFPAGSVREAGRIKVVPIASMPKQYDQKGAVVAGPCYKVFVGDHADYEFAQPARAVLHYIPALLPHEDDTKGLGVCVWNGKVWEALPTTVDPTNYTVAADVPHCSPVAVLWIGKIALAAGAGYTVLHTLAPSVEVWAGSSLVGAGNYFSHIRSETYSTANFTIHYTAEGPGAPPPDSGPGAFPLTPEHADPKYPNLVVLIGEILECSRSHLPEVGMPVADGWVFNHQVYLKPIAALGDTEYGGPIKLMVDWRDNGSYPPVDVLDARIRGTVTHELIHVAQSSFFSGAAMTEHAWWMEMTAAYLADVFWAKLDPKHPTDDVQNYYMTSASSFDLLLQPIDSGRDSNDYYRYARFLKWLEREGPDRVLRVIDRVNRGGDPAVLEFDRALQEEIHKSLGQLLREFAQDYYFYDLHDQTILRPPLSSGVFARLTNQTCLSFGDAKVFGAVGRVPSSGPAAHAVGQLNLYADLDVGPIAHLTTRAYPIRIQTLPKDRKAKMVIVYHSHEVDNLNLRLQVGRAHVEVRSVRAPMTAFEGIPLAAVQDSKVLSDLSAPDGDTCVMILLSSQWYAEARDGGRLERWFLLAPAWAVAQRTVDPSGVKSRDWEVGWHRAELKDYPKAFKGYNVYRRLLSDPETRLSLVQKEYADEHLTDHAPDLEDYAYTVRVVDALGNESADAPLDVNDPWQGTWQGKVMTVEGAPVDAFLKAVEARAGEADKKEQQTIAAVKDPQERAKQQQSYDEAKKHVKEVYDQIAQVLRTFEIFSRLGIPMTVKIRRTDGKYYFSIPALHDLMTQPDADGKPPAKPLGGAEPDEWEMKRDPANTQRFIGMPDELPGFGKLRPLELTLYRKPEGGQNEIRGEYEFNLTIDDKTEHCKFKWVLDREP